jgi:hypothetical protein
MTAQLTTEQRQLARRLSARGLSLREIGRQVGCSHEAVRAVVRRDSKRPVRSDPWEPGPGRLTLADREVGQGELLPAVDGQQLVEELAGLIGGIGELLRRVHPPRFGSSCVGDTHLVRPDNGVGVATGDE